MRWLGQFVMKGPAYAMLVAALTAVMALALPPLTSPLSYLGAAVIALVTLRKGRRQGGMVLAGAAVGTGVLGFVSLGSAVPVAVSTLVLWLPVWLLAGVLRRTVSLGVTLQFAGGLGVLLVILTYIVTGDPAAWWKGVLEPMFETLIKQGGWNIEAPELAQQAAQLMTGVMAALLVFGFSVSLLLARAWQAMLYNPGGFRSEFHGLRLGSAMAWLTVAVLLTGVWVPGQFGALASQSGMVLLVLYLISGLSLVHGAIAALGMHSAWLVLVYVLLVVLPVQMAVFLGVSGLLDAWLDWRGRLAARKR